MSGLRILVAGAGIAGCTVAYWLGKAGAQVTIVERSPALRTAGQGIDVEGPAVEVLSRMGLLEKARGRGSGETGIAYVDADNNAVVAFDVGKNDIGIVSEIEIMRGDLADLLSNAANDMSNVEFRYGLSITSISQTSEKVTVEYSDGSSKEEFDILIASDGLGSRTRDLIIDPEDRKDIIFSLGASVAYFSIPSEEQDGPRSRFFQAPGSRSMMIRPRDQKVSSVIMGIIDEDPRLAEALKSGVSAQKTVMAELFADLKWKEVQRVIKQMQATEDFYIQRVAQVRLDNWARGRCVLLGDTAYCPSPFSGQGTPLAIQGGYILAGEIMSKPDDPAAAFRAYEQKMKKDVKSAQAISMNGLLPKLLNPKTEWGLWVVRTILWLIANSGILRLAGLVRWLTLRGDERRTGLVKYDFSIASKNM